MSTRKFELWLYKNLEEEKNWDFNYIVMNKFIKIDKKLKQKIQVSALWMNKIIIV